MKKILLPLILILLLTFTLIGNCDWLADWDQRIEITLGDYAGDIGGAVTWFPGTVFLTSTQGEEIFTELTTDAEYLKTAVTKADGVTEMYVEFELFDVSETKGIFHTSKSDWAINANTSIFLYYDKDHVDNTEYISNLVSTLTEESAVDDIEAHQGVCTDGTFLYISQSHNIYKCNMAGAVQDTATDTHLDGTDMAQTNHIHLYDGKLYVGSNNYDAEPEIGYIKVFDADTLDYIEEHLVKAHYSEGCAFYDGAWWVVYTDWKYVSKYNTDWEWQADYEVDFPTTGNTKLIGYQGITWMGDDIFLPIHADVTPHPMIDRYHWTGSAFERRERITPPDDATQGICYLSSNDRFYIAQRDHPDPGKHGVVVTILDSAAAAGQVWDDDFLTVHHMADTTTSTLTDSTTNRMNLTKKGANEPLEVTGQIGLAQHFAGDDDYAGFGDNAMNAITANSFTIEAVTYLDALPPEDTYQRISDFEGRIGVLAARESVSGWQFQYYDGTGYHTVNNTNSYVAEAYKHLAVVWDKTDDDHHLYVDGGNLVTAQTSGTPDNSQTRGCNVGCDYSGTAAFWDGIIDEYRVSIVERNAAWIKGTYNSLWDTLFSYGAEEEVPGVGITWNGIVITKWNGVEITIPLNTQ